MDTNKFKNLKNSAIDFTKDKYEKAKNYSNEKLVPKAKDVAGKTKELATSSKDKIVKTLDQNGDNELTIEDVIIAGLKVPGVKIKRDEFLNKEFSNHHSKEEVEEIIRTNPLSVNISLSEIDKIADDNIQYERLCVSGISTALSVPGGVAMIATLPADMAQYYGYMLRIMQKLLYLYGFPEIDIKENQLLDAATMNTIILCMGVMYGVAGANRALKSMANALGKGVKNKLIHASLTKGKLYPMVKKIAKELFNTKVTKKIFGEFFESSIPVVGGVIGGGITYASFKPCCVRLKNTLRDTKLSNPNASESDLKEIINTEN